MNHGYGFETWEYSPDYAIRSWAYIGIHAALTLPARLVPGAPKSIEFYSLRLVLGTVCAFCEAWLFTKISRTLNPRVGVIFMLILLTSPGMFHASVAYLPSSFAMYTAMLGTAQFMDWRGGARTAQGIFWFGFGSALGWPFAGALILPFIGEELLLAFYTRSWSEILQRFVWGYTRVIIAAVFQFFTDLVFYRKYAFVPWNIIKYNVLAARVGKGPNIYGVEPWHFYIRNLVLNFHIWFLLALLALPAIYHQEFIRKRPTTKQSYIRMIAFTSPIYLWLTIFTLQPHKEERFMYPVYPLLAFNAAIAVHLLLAWLGSGSTRGLASTTPKLRLAAVGLILAGTVIVSVLRVIGIATAYDAPLKIYKPLHEPGVTRPGETVCLGKEWYRFPSHYHLPDGIKGKFIKSEFSGLMPGEFSEAGTGFGLFPGAWLVPPGMNDANIEDPGKYVSGRILVIWLDTDERRSMLRTATFLWTPRCHRCNRRNSSRSTSMIPRLGSRYGASHSLIRPVRISSVVSCVCLTGQSYQRYTVANGAATVY